MQKSKLEKKTWRARINLDQSFNKVKTSVCNIEQYYRPSTTFLLLFPSLLVFLREIFLGFSKTNFDIWTYTNYSISRTLTTYIRDKFPSRVALFKSEGHRISSGLWQQRKFWVRSLPQLHNSLNCIVSIYRPSFFYTSDGLFFWKFLISLTFTIGRERFYLKRSTFTSI